MTWQTRPDQAECKRCEKLFCYFRTGTCGRFYCGLCVEIERVELIEFLRAQRYARRMIAAHELAHRRAA